MRNRILKDIKNEIRKKFGLNIVKVKSLTNGFVNLNYICTTHDNKKYVLRVSRNKVEKELRLEAKLLDQLSQHSDIGHHITTMINDTNGEKIGITENIHYCLFHYVEGDHLVSMKDDHIQATASIMKRIHDAGMHIYHEYEEMCLLDTKEIADTLMKFYSEKIISNSEYSNMVAIVQLYNETITKYQSKTILHRDVHRNNLLFNKLNNKLVLIDFDDFCVGPAIIDLAIMVQLICLEKNVFDLEMSKKILHAYHAESHVKIEFNANDLLIFILFNLVIACEYYLRVTDIAKREQFLFAYHNIEKVQTASKNIINELSIFNADNKI